jgi:predicted MFS family arabinose efflux permease
MSPPRLKDRSTLQDIWLLVWGNLAVAAAVSFGRFAFAVLVPPMKESLGYSSGQIGWMGTSNFIGYSLGALTAGATSRYLARKTAILAGLALIAGTLLLVA